MQVRQVRMLATLQKEANRSKSIFTREPQPFPLEILNILLLSEKGTL